jgi:hypothetical protein
MNRIIKYFKDKQNSKLFAKLETPVLKFLYHKLEKCDIKISTYETTVNFDGLYENKEIYIKLIIKSYENILQIKYKNKKLFKKYSKSNNLQIMLIEMIIAVTNKHNNHNNQYNYNYSSNSNNKQLDPKSEKLKKLNNTLESYQNQYNDILKWEKINGKIHQDRLMVTSMIENVKDKIQRFSNKTT